MLSAFGIAALSLDHSKKLELPMKGRTFHSNEVRSLRNVPGETAYLYRQVLALEILTRFP